MAAAISQRFSSAGPSSSSADPTSFSDGAVRLLQRRKRARPGEGGALALGDSSSLTTSQVRGLGFGGQRELYLSVQRGAIDDGEPDAGEAELRRLFGGGPYFFLRPDDVPFDRSLTIGRTVVQSDALRWSRPYPNYAQFGRPELLDQYGRQYRVAWGEFVEQLLDEGLLSRSLWGEGRGSLETLRGGQMPLFFRLPAVSKRNQVMYEPPAEGEILEFASVQPRAGTQRRESRRKAKGPAATESSLLGLVFRVEMEPGRATGAILLRGG